MRKFIIDTDTGSDDAVALLLALKSDEIEVIGVTTVCGNVPLAQATQNALMCIEVSGRDVPLYVGSDRPLVREPVTALNVHGSDGMGDNDLVHPTRVPEQGHAVDYLIESARKYAGELELITIGPVGNVARAIQKDPEAMKGIKRVWTMGTGGFGPGNCTPVAEFNVFADAESYAILLQSGIPVTIVGFDLCLGKAAWTPDELERIRAASPAGQFAVDCNRCVLDYNVRRSGERIVDLPDVVAVAVALWDDVVLERVDRYCWCCTEEWHTYGQVILYDVEDEDVQQYCGITETNAEVIRNIDYALFKQRLEAVLSKK